MEQAWRKYASEIEDGVEGWNISEVKEWARNECDAMANLICDGLASKSEIEWTDEMAKWAYEPIIASFATVGNVLTGIVTIGSEVTIACSNRLKYVLSHGDWAWLQDRRTPTKMMRLDDLRAVSHVTDIEECTYCGHEGCTMCTGEDR